MTFAGLFAGTQAASALGVWGLLLIPAALWPLAALLAGGLPGTLRAAHPGGPISADLRRTAVELRAGFRRLLSTPPALGSVVSISLDQLLIGFVTVLGVVVFKEQFREGLASYGRLLGAGGVGVLAGILTVGRLESRLPRHRMVAAGFLAAAAVCLAVSLAPRGGPLLLLSFTLGMSFAWRKVTVDTIVQQAVPDRFRGRSFAIYDIAYSMARVLAALVAIPLIPRLSTATLLALTGCIYLAWSAVAPWWLTRPMLVGVRFYAGARADEVPRSVVVGGEEEPVELLGSRNELRGGALLRRFSVRTPDGGRLELVGPHDGSRWLVERQTAPPEARVKA